VHPKLNIAIKAALKAGENIIRSSKRLDRTIIEKKGNLDFVSNVDKECEEIIIETILSAYPDHAILAEESGKHGKSEYKWIIDPIDGTLNFLRGYPHFCVSIALMRNDRAEEAVIYDPFKDELFTCSRGNGAKLNDTKIRVKNQNSLTKGLLATGFAVRSTTDFSPQLKAINDCLNYGADIRRSGSAALDLAYTACGRLDGFWEFGLSPWDVAAGSLIVIESGGIVTDKDGTENYNTSGSIVAGNPKIVKALLKVIQ
tara:strand:- start:151 stop:921 length:771 start_codon:yes stop_codon:yes gene_type:complete